MTIRTQQLQIKRGCVPNVLLKLSRIGRGKKDCEQVFKIRGTHRRSSRVQPGAGFQAEA